MLSRYKEWGPCLSFGGELHSLCLALVAIVTEIEVASGQCVRTHMQPPPQTDLSAVLEPLLSKLPRLGRERTTLILGTLSSHDVTL